MNDIGGSQGSEYKNTVFCNMTSDSLLHTHRYIAEICCFLLQCVWVKHTPATWEKDDSHTATNLYHIHGLTFQNRVILFLRNHKKKTENPHNLYSLLFCVMNI